MTNLKIENLPNEVMKKVKETLQAYDRVNVTRENGEYKVLTGIMLKNEYADDHATLTIHKDEIYNENEKMLNYINTFRDFPINYEGKKDWKMINYLNEFSYADDSGCPVVKMDEDGNFFI